MTMSDEESAWVYQALQRKLEGRAERDTASHHRLFGEQGQEQTEPDGTSDDGAER